MSLVKSTLYSTNLNQSHHETHQSELLRALRVLGAYGIWETLRLGGRNMVLSWVGGSLLCWFVLTRDSPASTKADIAQRRLKVRCRRLYGLLPSRTVTIISNAMSVRLCGHVDYKDTFAQRAPVHTLSNCHYFEGVWFGCNRYGLIALFFIIYYS